MFGYKKIEWALRDLQSDMKANSITNESEFETLRKKVEDLRDLCQDIRDLLQQHVDAARSDKEVKQVVKDALHEYKLEMEKAEVKKVVKKK